jgi:hypothetical protein
MKRFLNVENTAASDRRITDPRERRVLFKVIKWVYRKIQLDLPSHCLRFDHDSDHCVLSFSITKPISALEHLSPLVENFNDYVRDVHVRCPEVGLGSAMTIDVDLYRKPPTSKRAATVVPNYSSPIDGSKREMFASEVERKIPSSQKKPPTWNDDVKVLHALSTCVHEMAEEVLETTVVLTTDRGDGEPDGSYELVFQGIESVAYSFLEATWERFGRRLGDVVVETSGISTRTVTFVIDGPRRGEPEHIVKRLGGKGSDGDIVAGTKRKATGDHGDAQKKAALG